jgi:hypothetical protein
MNRILGLLPVLSVMLLACEAETGSQARLSRTGFIQNATLDEISGMQSSRRHAGNWFVHNDDGGARVHAIDGRGRDLGSFTVRGAANRDWEDITAAPSAGGPLLIIGDTGDNDSRRDSVQLYFIVEPLPGADGRYSGSVELFHSVRLTYPDGARDCEALAFDPDTRDLLFLSKRDNPPRLYRIALDAALGADEAELELLGETRPFRPSSGRSLLQYGPRNGRWASHPTGMDIRADGRQAAVISYRSTYLFDRAEGENWLDALRREPLEFESPPSLKEEAIGFAPDGGHLMITAEERPAPLYRFEQLPGG